MKKWELNIRSIKAEASLTAGLSFLKFLLGENSCLSDCFVFS